MTAPIEIRLKYLKYLKCPISPKYPKKYLKRKLSSKRYQISMEFGILVGAVVAVVSIAGFYYLKHIKNSSFMAKESTSKIAESTRNKAVEFIDSVRGVLNNG